MLLKNLPLEIEFDEITFCLSLTKVRGGFAFMYEIESVEEDSPHYKDWKDFYLWNNPFENKLCHWLLVSNSFNNDKELENAVVDFKKRCRQIL